MNAFRTIAVVVVVVTIFAAIMVAFTVKAEPQLRDVAVISAETTDAHWNGVRETPTSTAVPIYQLGALDPWWEEL
jgi:hypothetical protein